MINVSQAAARHNDTNAASMQYQRTSGAAVRYTRPASQAAIRSAAWVRAPSGSVR